MFSNALSLLYIVMCFLGLQGLALAVFLIKHNRGGNQALLKATRNFILVSFLLGAFYFFTYYRELVLGEFEANAFMRAVDSIQFYAMGLTWLKLVDAIIASKNPRMDRLRKITTPV
ncbi:MAG: hypothetical protein RR661_06750, partial [Anaerovoracaceae bacterium]